MKYAFKYYRGCPYFDKADEIILRYEHRTTEILEHVDNYREDQRIILDYIMAEDISEVIDIFKALYTKRKNIAIKVYSEDDLKELNNCGIPAFYGWTYFSLDDLCILKDQTVSDVYIGGELGFFMKDVYHFCNKRNIKIRVVPNQATPAGGINSFFIRPEDVSLYENYIYAFEFFGKLDKQPVFYRIYNDLKSWRYPINFIIGNLHMENDVIIDNNTIMYNFGKLRLNCGKRCIFDKCSFCDRVTDLSKNLSKAKLEIVSPKIEVYDEAKEIYEDLKNDSERFSQLSGRFFEEEGI